MKNDAEIFYDDIYSLIKKLLINNKNYNNGYYAYEDSGLTLFNKLLGDTKVRAEYILERMEKEKHLIIDTPENIT